MICQDKQNGAVKFTKCHRADTAPNRYLRLAMPEVFRLEWTRPAVIDHSLDRLGQLVQRQKSAKSLHIVQDGA